MDQLEKLKTKVKNQADQINSLQKICRDLKAKNKNLQLQVTQQNKGNRENTRIKNLEKKLQSWKSKCQNAKDDLYDCEEDLRASEQELRENKRKLRSFEDKLKNLKEKHQKTLSKKQKEINNLNKQLKTQKTNNSKLTKELARTKKYLQEYEKELQDQLNQVDELNVKVEELNKLILKKDEKLKFNQEKLKQYFQSIGYLDKNSLKEFDITLTGDKNSTQGMFLIELDFDDLKIEKIEKLELESLISKAHKFPQKTESLDLINDIRGEIELFNDLKASQIDVLGQLQTLLKGIDKKVFVGKNKKKQIQLLDEVIKSLASVLLCVIGTGNFIDTQLKGHIMNILEAPLLRGCTRMGVNQSCEKGAQVNLYELEYYERRNNVGLGLGPGPGPGRPSKRKENVDQNIFMLEEYWDDPWGGYYY